MNSIHRKIQSAIVGSIIITGLCAAAVIFINQFSAQKNQRIIEIMTKEYGIITTTDSLIAKFNDVVKNTDDTNLVGQYDSLKLLLLNTVSSLKQEILSTESKSVFIGLENTVNQVIAQCDIGIKEASEGNLLNISTYFAQANKNNDFVHDNTSILLQKELEYLSAGEAESKRTSNLILGISLSFFVLLTLLMLVFAGSFSKQLVLPIEKLSDTTKRVIGGDFDIPIDPMLINQTDEVGVLSNSFVHMINAIKSKISELSDSNKKLESSQKSLEASNTQLEKVNSFMVGREIKMVELKQKIADLEKTKSTKK